jgi:hypothetical protein
MRLYNRTRLVLSCILPCYLTLGFLVSSFLATWKSEMEAELETRARLSAEEVALLLGSHPAENLTAPLHERVAARPWLKQMSVLDAYGRVVASDGSSLAEQGILAHDVARRRQITQAGEPFFIAETAELFYPLQSGGQRYIVRVGLDPGIVRSKIWRAAAWFLPGWLLGGLLSLLVALYLSRITLERMVSTLANQVNRVADGKSPDPLPVNEPALEPLADGLRRLFRSIDADRGRLGSLERNVSETRDRATQGRQEAERLVHQKEKELSLLREECRLLWERSNLGILRLDPNFEIHAANRAARQWLTLGPSPVHADLPKGLVAVVQTANEASGLSPSHGSFVVRHPFFGHERRMDATCIPLGPPVPPGGKPILVFLEERSAHAREITPETIPLEGFLRHIRGTILNVGQDMHGLEHLRKGPERTEKTRDCMMRLARVLRDLESLISAHRLDELLGGTVEGDTVGLTELPDISSRLARYLGVGASFDEPSLDEIEEAAEAAVILPRAHLELVLRESFALVSDLNGGRPLLLGTRVGDIRTDLTVAPREPGDKGLFATSLSEYLAKDRDLRKSRDLISLRVGVLHRLLEQAGGSLDLSPDRRGLVIGLPIDLESFTAENAAPTVDLARAFLR